VHHGRETTPRTGIPILPGHHAAGETLLAGTSGGRLCRSYKSVESILKNNLDTQELPETAGEEPLIHDNIRGREYYQHEEERHA